MATKTKLLTKVLGGKMLIAAHAAFAGGKSTMGTSRLSMDEFPITNANVCYSIDQQINNAQMVPDTLTVAMAATASVKMAFTVGDVIPNGQNQVMFLIYSTQPTSQAAFTSTVSDYQLGIPLSSIGVLGLYNLPAIQQQPQSPAAIGQADSSFNNKFVFKISLDTSKVAAMQASGQNQLYFQAGILNQADLEAGNFSNMVLSEVDSIAFIQGACPTGQANIAADSTGSKTSTATNNTSLSKSSASTNVGGKVSVPSSTSSGKSSTGSTSSSSNGKSTTSSTSTSSSSNGKSSAANSTNNSATTGSSGK